MNKQDFLYKNRKFVNFLTHVIAGKKSINHSYLNEAFSFVKLEDAFSDYVYPFKANWVTKYQSDKNQWRTDNKDKLFAANKSKLDLLSKQLKGVISRERSNSNEFYSALKRTLYWGATGEVVIPQGAERKGTYGANVKWLEENYPNKDELLENIINAVESINSENFESGLFGKKSRYRMNAGFTKVYSLIAENCIIYDGRVGAALGFLVTIFLKDTGEKFSDDLNFYWGSSESKERYRDPSIPSKGWIFSKLSNSNEKSWAECNVKANWLLSAAIDQLDDDYCFGGYKKENMLHAVEAALFMLGYDFPALKQNTITKRRVKPKSQKKSVKADDIRIEALSMIRSSLTGQSELIFTSSDLRKKLGADLTAICSAMNKSQYFSSNGIDVQVVSAPSSGLGKVTYRAAKR